MPNDEKELRIVSRDSPSPSLPNGLRLLKSIKARDSGTYLVPAPGLLPPGLHFSFHPSGEIHLKARDFEVSARIDVGKLVASLQSGEMDAVLASLIVAPAPGSTAEGVVVPEAIRKTLAAESGIVELPVELLAETIHRFEIDDTAQLAPALRWLRKEGILSKGSILLLRREASARETVFVNVGNEFTDDPANLPRVPAGTPFVKTAEVCIRQLGTFGGLFVTFPDDEHLRELATRLGLGEIFDAIQQLDQIPQIKETKESLSRLAPALEEMFGRAFTDLVKGPAIKPKLEERSDPGPGPDKMDSK